MSATDQYPGPALSVGHRQACWLDADGVVETLTVEAARRRVREGAPVLCHAPTVNARLGVEAFPCRDILELFAFVMPAKFCRPTTSGVADVIGLPRPTDLSDEAALLQRLTVRLCAHLAALPDRARERAAGVAMTLARADWSWGETVLTALGGAPARAGGLDAWTRVPEWDDRAPPAPPDDVPVSAAEAVERLRALLGGDAEQRTGQQGYAAASAAAFAPRDRVDEPKIVIAEAGTGIGKTLAYIAPASVWAEKNGAPAWLSTYTKNLQRQLDRELDRLFPNPAEKAEKVVVRKGRENYLCLLNFEEATRTAGARRGDAIAAGLMARWVEHTRDGDMAGGDFPSWLATLFGAARTTGLSDHRGECIYAACPHYRRCFIERSRAKAEHADIVIANHALVMIRAVLSDAAARPPVRYVFDEAHHLFDAADQAFSACLSGVETAELRRWLRGSEGRRRSRARGLEQRAADLVSDDKDGRAALDAILSAAARLPGEGWLQRLVGDQPYGPAEDFLALVRQQVYARARDSEANFSLEAAVSKPVDGLLDAAGTLHDALARLQEPLRRLAEALTRRLDEEADQLDSAMRQRIEGVLGGLDRRARRPIKAWLGMLDNLTAETPEDFVDWFSVERYMGRDFDVGFRRHWIDPTAPFAAAVLKPAHGALITSATLLDRSSGEDKDWDVAEVRTGAAHLALPATRASFASPFNYQEQTRVFVVTDVRRDRPDDVAAAYRTLFQASGGGALGLFTAIWRLRAVHKRIAPPLQASGLALYAQHVDVMDTGTLVEIFRAEEDSCLLGTDAVRDGVDVPGRALRLIVFDRVPWPRPDIMHRARRKHFGGSGYDDTLVRLRLKQAFGRLVRRRDDHGVFVMLDAMLPSRLLGAFPSDVAVTRLGLADAVAATAAFLSGKR